ncbi:KEOPS complex subunit Pcc1 [Halovenus sp. HT40]|uniref:KEOPS complex subunit Pcc1 n=1 Tax=Halovenus sp. HT40 TaxID=3126691 RepID=UPI00300E8CAC
MTGSRSAHIETEHADAETARAIAQALGPDNTAEMETVVDGRRIVTTIERDSTGGLQSTIDDYVVNLQVAVQLATTDGDTSTTTTNT